MCCLYCQLHQMASSPDLLVREERRREVEREVEREREVRRERDREREGEREREMEREREGERERATWVSLALSHSDI